MLVKELIEHLKRCPPGTPVLAKDVFGKPSLYIVLYPGPDGLVIDAAPEPDTRYCDHPFDGPGGDMLNKNKVPPTEKQLALIRGICDVLEIDYKVPKTKGESTVWLNHFVPLYNRRCEENELEWEANHSDLVNNCGDWRD